MEVKLNNIPDSSIEELPNEVLVMILARLPLTDRLRLSTLNRRWNQLVFKYFNNQLKLTLLDSGDYGIWQENPTLSDRVYRHISVTWSPITFKWKQIVDRFSANLVSLKIKIVSLEMFILASWSPPSRRVGLLCQTLNRLPLLTILEIELTVRTFLAVSDTIYKMKNLEKLTVRIKFSPREEFDLSNFNGLCRMPKLRKLSFGCQAKPRLTREVCPVEHVKILFLELGDTDFMDIATAFPSVKELNVLETSFADRGQVQVVNAWPALEVLIIRLWTGYFLKSFSPEILRPLPKLQTLKLLNVDQDDFLFPGFFNEISQIDFSRLDAILRIPTLTEVHVENGRYIRWTGTVPTTNPSCRLHVDGRYVPRGSVKRSSEQ